MTLNTLLHAVALWTISPLYILYYVRDLDASNSWIGLNTTLANLATIAGYALWRWIIERWGEMRTLKITILFAGVIPILVGLAGNLNIILAIVVVAGLVNPGISLSHITTLYKTMPSHERNRYMSVYMTFTNTGVFIFPMLGVWLADHFAYRWLLVVFGVLAIVGSASFIYHPVHLPTPPVPPAPPAGDGQV
jgi:MFS family permease